MLVALFRKHTNWVKDESLYSFERLFKCYIVVVVKLPLLRKSNVCSFYGLKRPKKNFNVKRALLIVRPVRSKPDEEVFFLKNIPLETKAATLHILSIWWS